MAWSVQGNIKGPKGDTGDTGPQGPKGDDGAGIQIAGSVATYGDLPPNLTSSDAGKGYLVKADGLLYIWDGTAFPADGSGTQFRGPQGPDGTAATITVGSVTTGAAGSSATVTNVGTSSAATFNFSIPQGAKGNTGATGSDGAAATVAVGTVSTGAAGSAATVTNSGTSSAAVFDFSIPKGDKGDTGADGATGTRGSKWYTGTGAPGSITGAQADDQYLDTDSGDVYTLS